MNDQLQQRANVLIEALPYIREFHDQLMVVKYGGKAMVDDELKRMVVSDIALLRYVGITPIVVHGGGPEITKVMQRMGKEPKFIRGLRVTDAETAEIAEMVLAGKIQQELVQLLNGQGVSAVGLSGKDANLLTLCKVSPEQTEGVDIGFVGDIQTVNPRILNLLTANQCIPVVSCIGGDEEGNTLNLNADHLAGKLAAALGCAKLIMLTDVKGIYADASDETTLKSVLSVQESRELVEQGIVDRGMIPKVEACLWALEGGVEKTHIINGAHPHALLMEMFTDKGIGTMILDGGR